MTVEVLKNIIRADLPVPVDRVLDGARDLTSVVVVGIDENGDLHVASTGGSAESVFLLERGKATIIRLQEGE